MYTWSAETSSIKFNLWFHAPIQLNNIVGHIVCRRCRVFSVAPSNVRLECAPSLAQLVADGTLDKTVEVRLDVVAHLGLVLIAPVAHVTLPDHPLAVGAHQPAHAVIDLLIQVNVQPWKHGAGQTNISTRNHCPTRRLVWKGNAIKKIRIYLPFFVGLYLL